MSIRESNRKMFKFIYALIAVGLVLGIALTGFGVWVVYQLVISL